MSGPTVPFVDLAPQHEEVRDQLMDLFARALRESAFVGGESVTGFESDFGRYLGIDHVIGVANGTDAVRIALQMAGLEPGDAIVTVSHTFIGTTEGASQIGAVPYFVDVDESATMDPAALGRFLDLRCRRGSDGVLRHSRSSRRIAAIVPVHLYGQSADMEAILDIAAAFGVPVVEDAAQAQGATYRFDGGRVAQCGTMGVAGAFSFYPGKNLGAVGEAGAVVTADPERAALARRIRDHGQSEKYVHEIATGGNFRLDAIQAGVLAVKLRRLDAWNDARRARAARYDEVLADVIQRPVQRSWAHHVYHLYVVQHAERDRLRAELGEAGIQTGMHYPIPLHLQPAFAGTESAADVDLPETERLAATCLSLPMYPHLDIESIDRVAEAIAERTKQAVRT